MSLSSPSFKPPVIACRGARANAPENTIAAFQQAVKQGATWIQTEVKLTSDGVPILMHDETLDRTTNGKGKVADTVWSEIKNLDAGSWFKSDFAGQHVPTLAAALAFALEHKVRLNLELRPCEGRTQATVMVALIEAAKIWPDNVAPPLISSFSVDALVVAAQLHPEWPRGLLLKGWHDDWIDLIKKTDPSTLHVDEEVLTEERIKQLNQVRLPILAYTVNKSERAHELLQRGVAAVFSDCPGEIIKAL